MPQASKVLFFDIETAPLLSHHWRMFRENIGQDQNLATQFMLCWTAKWAGAEQVLSDQLTPQEVLDQDDSRIVLSLADLLRQADVVVAHNGDRFDLPEVNRRVLIHGHDPLGPIETIDTLKLAKKNFRFVKNSLDFLAEELGLGRKIKTDFDLWRDCYQGDERAMRDMVEYAKQDTVLLEKVFERMRPHVRRLKRLYDADHDWQVVCPSCGTEGVENFQRRGYYRTQASTFPKYQCKSCKRYHRGRSSVKSKRAKLYPL